MMDISSNIKDVMNNISHGLREITYEDQVMRTVATSMVAVVHDRIHEQGKDANDSQIGTYSNSYMAVRTGAYKNKPKKDVERKTYNRTSDTKVILSLTRQMENDFSVIATTNGYGLGYKNELNFNKANWAEKNYDKAIFKLTETEEKQVIDIANFEVNRLTNG